jgi:site-specific recombinase XerD
VTLLQACRLDLATVLFSSARNLAAENKAEKTVRVYIDAVCWFAAAHLLRETDKTRWEQVEADDVRRWMVRLLREYSDAYAYQQFRSLDQFFQWLASEDGVPEPMGRLRPPKVEEKPVPHFSSDELSRLERACRGNSFEDRRDAAIIAVLLATGLFSRGAKRSYRTFIETCRQERGNNLAGVACGVAHVAGSSRAWL